VAGAVYFPNSGYCDPHQFVLQLAKAAEALGAKFRTHTHVNDLCIRDRRVTALQTQDEKIAADAVVLTCGAWTPN
jgi:glycine/D-amino acid oxidase-like deaminating enzyme